MKKVSVEHKRVAHALLSTVTCTPAIPERVKLLRWRIFVSAYDLCLAYWCWRVLGNIVRFGSLTASGMFLGSREERRWIEKQNKAARQKLKKEEVARIRQLVGEWNSKLLIVEVVLLLLLFCYGRGVGVCVKGSACLFSVCKGILRGCVYWWGRGVGYWMLLQFSSNWLLADVQMICWFWQFTMAVFR